MKCLYIVFYMYLYKNKQVMYYDFSFCFFSKLWKFKFNKLTSFIQSEQNIEGT